MKRYLEDYASLFLVSGLVIALDQWTKSLIRANLEIMETWVPWPWLEPYARLLHWKNTGAAFGMFENLSDVFKVLAVVVSIGIIYFYPKLPREDWLMRLALGMQMGGALGNFIDRVTIGWVTDFISVGNFAIFNVADASISVGVAVLLVGMWIKERKEAALANTGQLPPPAAPLEDSGE